MMLASDINKATLEYLYVKWIINQNLPFDLVEDHDFRVFLNYVNEAANSLLPTSHNTIKSRIMQLFWEEKQRIRSLLHTTISDIYITCDLWSLDNSLGLLGIVAHFTSENCPIILQSLNDFEIRNRLGYFMMDNASSNDTLSMFPQSL